MRQFSAAASLRMVLGICVLFTVQLSVQAATLFSDGFDSFTPTAATPGNFVAAVPNGWTVTPGSGTFYSANASGAINIGNVNNYGSLLLIQDSGGVTTSTITSPTFTSGAGTLTISISAATRSTNAYLLIGAAYGGTGTINVLLDGVPTTITQSFTNPILTNTGFAVYTATANVAAGNHTVALQWVAPTATINGNSVSDNMAGFDFVQVDGPAAPGPATQIAKNLGDNQTVTVNTFVVVSPSVLVTDASNNPVSGATVTFAVASGGGSLSGSGVATSNASGIATIPSNWRLGTVAGTNNNTLTATLTVGNPLVRALSTSVTFTASAVAATPAQIAISAGNNQTATVNSTVAVAPSVIVKDIYNNVVNGATVTYTVEGGGGSVTGGVATSIASGIATVGSWRLGTVAGTNNNSLTATLTTSKPTVRGNYVTIVTFAASGTPGPATDIFINGGNNQSAPINTNVAIPPSVLVKDTFGNIVSGASVNFAIGLGGGFRTGSPATSNASGIATVGSWTLGPTGGTNTLIATLGQPLVRSVVTTQTFTAIATGASPDLNGDGIFTPIDQDNDGDGFPDYIETALGTNPLNAASFPFTLPDPEGVKFRARTDMKLNPLISGKDKVVVYGIIHLFQGEVVPGTKVLLDVGGNQESFTLDKSGKGESENATFQLIWRHTDLALVSDAEAHFKLTYKPGSYFAKILLNSYESFPVVRKEGRIPDHVVVTIVIFNRVLRAIIPLNFKTLGDGSIKTVKINTNAK